jgi:hypothetical protein
MHCGDTFLIPAPGSGDETPHLWIVVTEPDPLCVIVCLSTLRFNKDQTVLLRAGEHSFVRRDTAVLYMYAEIVDADHLRRQVADGRAVSHDPCTVDVLRLIQDGILASPLTPRKVQNFYWERKK